MNMQSSLVSEHIKAFFEVVSPLAVTPIVSTAVYGAITDNWPTIEPYFNETGSNCPSILPRVQQRELMDLGIQSVQALGFQQVSAACLHSRLQHKVIPAVVALDLHP